jgi:hypothetical protein
MTPITREAKPEGVPAFDEKMILAGDLVGVKTYREVVYEVFSRVQDRSLAKRVALRVHRMRDHYPTNKESRLFWDGLAARLGCDGDKVTGAMLIDASFSEFVEYLPSDLQEKARGRNLTQSRYAPYPSIDLTESRPVETIVDGLGRGRIDQKHYYLGADSANAWFSLVRAEAYPSYDDCKLGLQALVASDQWKRELSSAQPKSVVMLAGGGAPTKDLLLLRNMLAQPHIGRRLDYYLVDISLYMLRESRLFIEEHGKTIEGIEKVKVIARERDILKMTDRQREEFHKQGPAVFTLTAGTIGNLSESAFFASLNQASSDGDLFVLTADTIEGPVSNETKNELIGKYSHSAFRKWIQPVVQRVLSESGAHERVESAVDRVHVDVLPGAKVNSDVPASWSVILTLEINKKPITLLSSTRYEAEQLTQFAAGFGWELVHQASGPYSPHFRQFLFRRKKAEEGGIRSRR